MSESQVTTTTDARYAKVSVIIPAYNGERFIRAAIESVRGQTLPISEIIVVNDGSRDRTADIARELGVTLIQQPNKGVCAARNAGINIAANDWVAFIDQDDLWEPQKIECQWNVIQRYPDVAVVSCHMSWFADESICGRSPEIAADGGYGKENDGCIAYFHRVQHELPFNRMIDYTSSVLIRRDVLLAVGMFNEDLRQNEDLECFLRLIARSPLAIVRRSLVWHRVHDRNTSLCDPEGAAVAYDKILNWLRSHPETYPPGAARAYGVDFARRQASDGRALLESGQPSEARVLLRQSLARAFSGRAFFLWSLSFLSPAAFRYLLSLKRALVARLSRQWSVL